MAESCPHLAIAGTAYYALGLVATTAPGSEVGYASSYHPLSFLVLVYLNTVLPELD